MLRTGDLANLVKSVESPVYGRFSLRMLDPVVLGLKAAFSNIEIAEFGFPFTLVSSIVRQPGL